MNQKELFRLLDAELSRPGEADETAMALTIRHFSASAPLPEGQAALQHICLLMARRRGIQSVFNLLKRLEVSFAFRKPALAIYDHTLHLIGGAQKYGCTIAHALQDEFDVTLIANKPVQPHDLQNWYQLDLSRCRIVTIPIPFYEEHDKEHIDPAAITSRRMANPFHIISLESGRYDFFINNSMVEMVFPLANLSLFVCHFPERRPNSYFYVDRYRHLIFNSRYTAEWIKRKWGLQPGIHIYPPVDMNGSVNSSNKENIILSAARFDPGGNKQQLRMVKIFKEMGQHHAHPLRGWKLILAGGSPRDNSYLNHIQQIIAAEHLENIELRVNLSAAELKSLYQRAKIFWHLCGLNQNEPELVEHFGMTTAEAMQNGCVPVVFAGGGLVEIVENQVSGLLFSSTDQLCQQTLGLIIDPHLLLNLSEQARQRAKIFDRGIFETRVKGVFGKMLDDYRMAK